MTVEERFERIEHIRAGMVEQGRKDREEDRQLWRETQRHIDDPNRQIDDLTRKIADTNDVIVRLGEESRAADQRLREHVDAADQQLRERIEALVSAIGKMLAK